MNEFWKWMALFALGASLYGLWMYSRIPALALMPTVAEQKASG